jgi:hypothetical protein
MPEYEQLLELRLSVSRYLEEPAAAVQLKQLQEDIWARKGSVPRCHECPTSNCSL